MNITGSLSNHYNNFANSISTTASTRLTDDTASALKEGQVFEGSINSIDDKGRVVIGMSDGSTMNARLAPGVEITQGQSLFFQVKSNDGAMIQIKPVSLNIESNPTLLKALDSANIVATEKNISMVNMMMQESMPINSESLVAMNRAMLANPGVDPSTIVMMSKFNLPVTTENANVFEAYTQDSAAIKSDVAVISDGLANLLSDESLSVSESISLNNEINKIFNSNHIEASQLDVSQTNTIAKDSLISEINENFDISPNDTRIVQDASSPKINSELLMTEQTKEVIKDAQAEQDIAVRTEILAKESDTSGSSLLGNALTPKQLTSLQNILETFPDFSKGNEKLFTADGNIKPNISTNQLFNEITNYLNNNPETSKASLKDLFSNPGFKNLLNNVIENSITLKPEDITKPGAISKLYERVLKQNEALEASISKFNTKASDTVKEATSNIKNNINFMNSANELYNIVQIPLKMYNQNTDSMLYVRQNKKKAYENGEEITAFLHFDMQYLGSTDVFIKLKERDVSCDWTLEDESSLKLIEDNLDLLNERLAAKGYNSTMKCRADSKKPDFVADFLRGGDSEHNGLVHRYSFDMRA